MYSLSCNLDLTDMLYEIFFDGLIKELVDFEIKKRNVENCLTGEYSWVYYDSGCSLQAIPFICYRRECTMNISRLLNNFFLLSFLIGHQ